MSVAVYKKVYKDGLKGKKSKRMTLQHWHPYDSSNCQRAYLQGFEAGLKERNKKKGN